MLRKENKKPKETKNTQNPSNNKTVQLTKITFPSWKVILIKFNSWVFFYFQFNWKALEVFSRLKDFLEQDL